MKLYPESCSLTSIYIPRNFDPVLTSTSDKTLDVNDLSFEMDNLNKLSIIKLKSIPYIDLTRFDHDRQRWFYIDGYGNNFRVYNKGEYVLEYDYIFDGTFYVPSVSLGYSIPVQTERFAICSDLGYDYIYNPVRDQSIYFPVAYNPISLSINGRKFIDKTDYFNNTSSIPSLNNINPDFISEFYYNLDGIIYTNQDFGSVNLSDLELSYYTTINNINVKCRMATNSKSLSGYTPMVDYYSIKLTGQTI